MDINSVSGQTPAPLIQQIIVIAGQAASAILDIYHSNFAIEHKDDDSPLTAADLASHHTICKALITLTPDVPILSEESATVPWSKRKTWDTYWLIDPLDGTREFIKRNGEFTVNIALIHHHRPVLGVVHVPARNTVYFASSETGAWIKNGEAAPQSIHTRRTSASQLKLAGSRSHGSEKQTRFLKSLGPDIQTFAIGSSLKFCLIAEGKLDFYARFGPTSEWDSAAAQCVVEQSGGLVTDMQFQSLRYNTKESLRNPDFLVIADQSFDWKSRLDKIA